MMMIPAPATYFPSKLREQSLLKEAIKDKKQVALEHVDADALQLWNVSIIVDDGFKENVSKVELRDEEELSPVKTLSSWMNLTMVICTSSYLAHRLTVSVNISLNLVNLTILRGYCSFTSDNRTGKEKPPKEKREELGRDRISTLQQRSHLFSFLSQAILNI